MTVSTPKSLLIPNILAFSFDLAIHYDDTQILSKWKQKKWGDGALSGQPRKFTAQAVHLLYSVITMHYILQL